MPNDAYFTTKVTMAEYLADLGRSSGSSLRMAATEPERYGLWLAGKNVDRPTPAKGQGSLLHHLLQFGDEGVSNDFAFYPNRQEAMVPEMAIPDGVNPRTGAPFKTKKATGKMVPQDASPDGAFKSMETRTKEAKRLEREFFEGAKGRTVVWPESMRTVNAMRRAVQRHPEAASLLMRDGVFAPEVTGHFTERSTGEPCRVRYDGLRASEDVAIEIKTIAMKGEERLDPSNGARVKQWAMDGWAYKSAMYHDAYLAVTGRPCVLQWILVEAREDDPRVCVVEDHHDSIMAGLGRHGNEDYGFIGYIEAIRRAQYMRETKDFRHQSTLGVLGGFEFPGHFVTSMEFDEAARGEGDYEPAPEILGATPAEAYGG